jgi:hypothetical protein
MNIPLLLRRAEHILALIGIFTVFNLNYAWVDTTHEGSSLDLILKWLGAIWGISIILLFGDATVWNTRDTKLRMLTALLAPIVLLAFYSDEVMRRRMAQKSERMLKSV